MEDYGHYSHASYEALEDEIKYRIQEIMKLSIEEQQMAMSTLASEIYYRFSGQYDIQIIQDLIDSNIISLGDIFNGTTHA